MKSLYFKRIGIIVILILNGIYSGFSQTISTLGIGSGGPNPSIRTVYVDSIDNYLYIGGDFKLAGGKFCWGIARWNGTQWDSLGLGMKPVPPSNMFTHIKKIVRYKNEIYVTGNFRDIGGKKISGLARWNGTDWNNVGGKLKRLGQTDLVVGYTMEVYNNELYVTGNFDTIGTTRCTRIAKWDGLNWTNLGDGHHPTCYQDGITAMTHYQGELYVAGNINCSFQPEPISKLVGNTWVDVGPGLFGGGWINEMKEFQGKLYIAGYFSSQSGNIDNNLISTDGISYFGTAGGVMPSNCLAVQEHKGELYAGGQIDFAGSQAIKRIGKWNGFQWLPSLIDIGNGTINAMENYNGKLVLVGGINNVNGINVNNIALIDFSTVGFLVIQEDNNLTIFPNPTSQLLNIKIKKGIQEGSVKFYNQLGQLVYTQSEGVFKTIDVSTFAKGVYFAEVRQEDKVMRQKVVVE